MIELILIIAFACSVTFVTVKGVPQDAKEPRETSASTK